MARAPMGLRLRNTEPADCPRISWTRVLAAACRVDIIENSSNPPGAQVQAGDILAETTFRARAICQVGLVHPI